MKHEPISYKEPTGNSAGCYYGSLSPDGWTNNWYQTDAKQTMEPDERHEFVRLVCDFFKSIKERNQLDAYARKYGKLLKPGALPTFGVTVDEDLMVYNIQITGCNVEFRPYRKEK